MQAMPVISVVTVFQAPLDTQGVTESVPRIPVPRGLALAAESSRVRGRIAYFPFGAIHALIGPSWNYSQVVGQPSCNLSENSVSEWATRHQLGQAAEAQSGRKTSLGLSNFRGQCDRHH
jgi:hypothetical protein